MSSNNNGQTRYEIIFEYGNLQQYTADEHTSKVLAIAEHNNRDEREEARFRKALVAGLRGHDSIGTLAEICCISESTFKRRFRARSAFSRQARAALGWGQSTLRGKKSQHGG